MPLFERKHLTVLAEDSKSTTAMLTKKNKEDDTEDLNGSKTFDTTTTTTTTTTTKSEEANNNGSSCTSSISSDNSSGNDTFLLLPNNTDTLNLVRNILSSTKAGSFDVVLSNLRKLVKIPDDCINDLRKASQERDIAERILLNCHPNQLDTVVNDLRVLLVLSQRVQKADTIKKIRINGVDLEKTTSVVKNNYSYLDDCIGEIRQKQEQQQPTKKNIKNQPIPLLHTFCSVLGGNLMKYILLPIHDFFHLRTGPHGCRLVGYMRVCYAILFLYSRSLMAYDLIFLMDPQNGVMPYRSTRYTMDDDDYSVFKWFPHNPYVLYGLFSAGMVFGILFLLGVAPRFQAIGIFFFLYNFQNHNSILFDHQDVMMRMYVLMLALSPLDHITIYDRFGYKRHNTSIDDREQTSSWPMWPFRIWQGLVCLVYIGAGIGKLSAECWTNGTALFYPPYEEGFGRFWNPDFIFNRMGPIKLLTWGVLLLECTCFITIWPLATRKITFASIVLLHVGIELTMIMHIFQYISVLGWVVFLIRPNDGRKKTTTAVTTVDNNNEINQVTKLPSRRRRLIDTIIAVSLLSLMIIDSLPTGRIMSVLPHRRMRKFVKKRIHRPLLKARSYIYDAMNIVGLHTGEWTLFSGVPTHENHRYTAVIRFNNGTEPVVWRNPDWTHMSYIKRELTLWSDSYYFYLWNDNDEGAYPIIATFNEYLARTFSLEGAITYQHRTSKRRERLMIQPNNTVSSISLVIHTEQGLPPDDFSLNPDNWWTEPARQPNNILKGSDCMFVMTLPKSKDRTQYIKINYIYNPDRAYDIQSGCNRYDDKDDKYHAIGSYAGIQGYMDLDFGEKKIIHEPQQQQGTYSSSSTTTNESNRQEK